MKYVIIKLDAGATPRVYGFIFSEHLVHKEAARFFERIVSRQFDYPAEVYSAGFCQADGAHGIYVSEHGSESLNIKRDDGQAVKDAAILNMPRYAEGALSYVE